MFFPPICGVGKRTIFSREQAPFTLPWSPSLFLSPLGAAVDPCELGLKVFTYFSLFSLIYFLF